MNDNQRIDELKKHLKLSSNALAKALNLKSPQIFYDIKAGKCGISKDLATKIQDKYFNVNMSWLLTGEGEMLKTDDNLPMINYERRGVPYYDVDFIGGFDLVVNDQSTNPNYYIDCRPYNDATCWVNVTGHSMEPGLCSGDMVALKQVSIWSEFLLLGEIYAIVTDDFRTIKMITKSDHEDCYRLVPLNKSPEYHEQDLPKRLIRNIFKVQGSIKRY